MCTRTVVATKFPLLFFTGVYSAGEYIYKPEPQSTKFRKQHVHEGTPKSLCARGLGEEFPSRESVLNLVRIETKRGIV